MRILVWHMHGGWTDAFVRGPHEYLLPVDHDRSPWGLGQAGRDWPAALEVPLEHLRGEHVDLVVLQRLEELDLAERVLGRRPGGDVPAVFVEHNTPKPNAVDTRHPLADRHDIELVHVTHFNRLMWDSGNAPTTVIEHGIPDPGLRYSGELARMAAVMNEPVRRGRITGSDLLPRFALAGGIDVFGIGVDALPEALGLDGDFVRPSGDLPTGRLHDELARRRLYLHTTRWTSLGLSLLEAMHLGLPVVVLQTTEAARAVPPGAGICSTDVAELVDAARFLLDDADAARRLGRAAREAALARYGLARFHRDWGALIGRVTGTATIDAHERSSHAHRHDL